MTADVRPKVGPLDEAVPQASMVQRVNKPGVLETDATRERDDVAPGW